MLIYSNNPSLPTKVLIPLDVPGLADCFIVVNNSDYEEMLNIVHDMDMESFDLMLAFQVSDDEPSIEDCNLFVHTVVCNAASDVTLLRILLLSLIYDNYAWNEHSDDKYLIEIEDEFDDAHEIRKKLRALVQSSSQDVGYNLNLSDKNFPTYSMAAIGDSDGSWTHYLHPDVITKLHVLVPMETYDICCEVPYITFDILNGDYIIQTYYPINIDIHTLITTCLAEILDVYIKDIMYPSEINPDNISDKNYSISLIANDETGTEITIIVSMIDTGLYDTDTWDKNNIGFTNHILELVYNEIDKLLNRNRY